MSTPQNDTRDIEFDSIPKEIKEYLDTILVDANLYNAEESVHQGMLKEMYERLDKYIAIKVVENLPADKLDEFIRLNDERRPREEVEKFLKDNMPNTQEVIQRAFVEFRDMYLQNVPQTK